MANMQECIDSLRRKIGDTVQPYTYDDTLLTGYVADGVSEVELDYPRGIVVQYGLFTNDITTLDVSVFTIKAYYLFTMSLKSQADRNNFRMVKGRLTLDNTIQSSSHKETIEIIIAEYRRTLSQLKSGGQLKGVRVE